MRVSGYKQRGQAAEETMNVFIHLTYDGEVQHLSPCVCVFVSVCVCVYVCVCICVCVYCLLCFCVSFSLSSQQVFLYTLLQFLLICPIISPSFQLSLFFTFIFVFILILILVLTLIL